MQRGVLAVALDAITARVRDHFAGGTPSPQDISDYIASLPVWTKIGMTEQEFYAYPPAWRVDQGRSFQPPPAAHSRRPQQGYVPTPAQQVELDAITNRDDKVTRYRQMRDEAAVRA